MPQRRPALGAMPLGSSLAVRDRDRTRAIFGGRSPIEGCEVTAIAREPGESFHRAVSSRRSTSPKSR
jgi:hypothetical protein